MHARNLNLAYFLPDLRVGDHLLQFLDELVHIACQFADDGLLYYVVAVVFDVDRQVTRRGPLDREGQLLQGSQGGRIRFLQGDGALVRMQFVAEGLRRDGHPDQFVDVGGWHSSFKTSVVLPEEHRGDDQSSRVQQTHGYK